MRYRYKIGETAHLAGKPFTRVWCADCSGQGRNGHVGAFGLFEETGGTCAECQGQGRRWVPASDVLRWVPCTDGMHINLASTDHPLRTYGPMVVPMASKERHPFRFRDILVHLGLTGRGLGV